MNAEIIAVGSELLTPQRVDTNSLYLTEVLNALGVEVVQKGVVGDDRVRLREAVKAALERSEIVVLSGGLGPTEDDLTRDAVAAALGRGLAFRQDILDGIEARFRRVNRTMSPINRRQAYVIEGAEALPNERGTAPGQFIEAGGRYVLLLPGPPSELKPMFAAECVPRLRSVVPPLHIATRRYRIALMPESEVDQLISPVYTKYQNPITTILAAAADIQVHLRARCVSREEAEALCAELGGQIEALLGDRIYSRDGSPLEAVVGELLRERGETVSVAESATGGLLAARFTDVPGSSDYFVGGFVTYTDETKARLLGIDPALIREHTAVSEPVARAMALQARELTGATYALSITGEAGPKAGTESPAGTLFVGLASESGVEVRSTRSFGDRQRVRAIATQMALEMLRRLLGK